MVEKTRPEKRRKAKERDANTFELTLGERIGLLMVLPKQGDLFSLRILRDLEHALAPDEEDAKKANLRNMGQGLSWNPTEARKIKKVVVMGERAKELLAQGIAQAGKQQKLDIQWLELYEKFVPVEDPSTNGHKEEPSG